MVAAGEGTSDRGKKVPGGGQPPGMAAGAGVLSVSEIARSVIQPRMPSGIAAGAGVLSVSEIARCKSYNIYIY